MRFFSSKWPKRGSTPVSVFILLAIVIVISVLVLKPKFAEQLGLKTAEPIEISLEPINSNDLLTIIERSPAQLKMLNLWATWCAPCIAEFPYLLKIRENYQDQGLELILVSMDMSEEEDRVRVFLREQGVDFTTYLKNEGDHDFINALNPDWSGALPATFLFGEDGRLIKFWTGDKDYEGFKAEVDKVLSPNP